MASSPWGAIQHSQVLKRGMRVVSTAGHGGVMVTLKAAEKYLSEEARKRGQVYGNYLCYEEDCELSIPVFENPDIWDKFHKDNERAKLSLLRSLSMYNGDYLVAIGVEPIAGYYDVFLEGRERDRLLSEESPDLIVAASGTEIPGVVIVFTADGKKHLVIRDSYKEQTGRLKLLSKCTMHSA